MYCICTEPVFGEMGHTAGSNALGARLSCNRTTRNCGAETTTRACLGEEAARKPQHKTQQRESIILFDILDHQNDI